MNQAKLRFDYIKKYFENTHNDSKVFNLNYFDENKSEFDDLLNLLNKSREKHNIANVYIVNEDCLDVTINCIINKSKEINYINKPLLLNLANGHAPCANFYWGITQEEWIFRNSNAYYLLSPLNYPLLSDKIKNMKTIYSPNLKILKQYKNLDEKEYDCSMFTIDAIISPIINHKKFTLYKNDNDYELMYKKIEFIFKIAILNKHTTLILGAFGCGCFNNPPETVSKIFNNMIEKYGKYFDDIYFSILILNEKDQNIFNTFSKNILNNKIINM